VKTERQTTNGNRFPFVFRHPPLAEKGIGGKAPKGPMVEPTAFERTSP